MFKLPTEIGEYLESNKLQVSEHRRLPYSLMLLPDALDYFIDTKLAKLNEHLYERFKNHKGYAYKTIAKYINNQNSDVPPSKDLVNLLCYYCFSKPYIQCVEDKTFAIDARGEYSLLNTKIKVVYDNSTSLYEDSRLQQIQDFVAGRKYTDAEELYHEVLSSDAGAISILKARLDLAYAKVLKEYYGRYTEGRSLLIDCLDTFRDYELVPDMKDAVLALLEVCLDLNDYQGAEIFLVEFLRYIDEFDDDTAAGDHIKAASYWISQYHFTAALSRTKLAKMIGTKFSYSNRPDIKKRGYEILGHAYALEADIHKLEGMEGEAQRTYFQAMDCFSNAALNDAPELAMTLYEQARCDYYLYRPTPKEWQYILDLAKPIFERHNCHFQLASCLVFESNAAMAVKDFETAINKLLLAENEINKTKNKHYLAWIKKEFAEFYLDLGVIDPAFFHYNEIFEASKNDPDMIDSKLHAEFMLSIMEIEPHRTNHLLSLRDKYLVHLALSHGNVHKGEISWALANIYCELNDFQQALASYEGSLSLWKQLRHTPSIAKCLERMAEIYEILGQHEKMYTTSLELIKLVKATELFEMQAIANQNCGRYLAKQSKGEEAKSYLENAYFLAERYNLPLLEEIMEQSRIMQELRKTQAYQEMKKQQDS